MNITEYNIVKELTYTEYCDYLQKKYGKSQYDYMTKSYNKNPKVTRTAEGLFAHHKYEDHAIDLSSKEWAMLSPFEYQKAENIVYCDYLEHLLLHVLICEYPQPDKPEYAVGIGGIQNFIVPELNDLYSGLEISLAWKQNCFNKVKDDVDCYITIVRRFIENSSNHPLFDAESLRSSANEKWGTWSALDNDKLTEKFFLKEFPKKGVKEIVLPHNRDLYEEMKEKLDTTGKVLVVLGTGLGKTTTALQYLFDKGYKALVITPNCLIKNGWSDYPDHCVPTTIQSFSRIVQNGFGFLRRFDIIIIDEAHHIGYDDKAGKGAAVWFKAVDDAVKATGIKVLGLTATPVRSDRIDVGAMFFGGSVCRGLDITSAIQKQIVYPFSYITSVYDKNELEELARTTIKDFSDEDRRILMGKFNLAIQHIPTVQNILYSNAPARRKGVIFVSNSSEFKQAIEIMKSCYPQDDIRILSDKQNHITNEINRKWFKDTNSGWLVTINMFSEGAHYQGVNILVMFRPVRSSLIFNQQVGRIVTLTKYENPNAIVFDFVNNINTLQHFEDREEGEHSGVKLDNGEKIKDPLEKLLETLAGMAGGQVVVKSYVEDFVTAMRKVKASRENKNRECTPSKLYCFETGKFFNKVEDAERRYGCNIHSLLSNNDDNTLYYHRSVLGFADGMRLPLTFWYQDEVNNEARDKGINFVVEFCDKKRKESNKFLKHKNTIYRVIKEYLIEQECTIKEVFNNLPKLIAGKYSRNDVMEICNYIKAYDL